MDRDSIDNALKKIFSELFLQPEDTFSYETTPDNLSNWDSMAQIRIISSIEEEFSIEISPEQQNDMLTFELIGDITKEITG
jgi:acyl carrier protein